MEKYYVLQMSEDGDFSCTEYESLKEMSDEYAADEMALPETLDKLPDDWNYIDQKIVIIKGNIVVPKVKKIATVYEDD